MSRTVRRTKGDKFMLKFAEDKKGVNRYHSDAYNAKAGGMDSEVKAHGNMIRRSLKRKDLHDAKSGLEMAFETTEKDVKNLSNKGFIHS